MIVSFEKIKQYEILLSDIKAIRQEPSYRVLVNKHRRCNGFMCVIKGNCKYEYDGGEITLSNGGVAYLPFGSRHTLTVTSKDISFYRVDFTLRIANEIALFSDKPLKITDNIPSDCIEAIEALLGDYKISENSIERTKNLCILLSGLQNTQVNPAAKRLMPAVNYLNTNAFCGVNCEALAKLCFLSTSRFYDLFKAEFEVTPLEYRNNLLIHRVTSFLSAGDITIKETAIAMGFKNVAYFSRFFKRHLGMTPSEYIKRKNENSIY